MTDTPVIETVRHELRVRSLAVVSVERPTPRLVRIGLHGPELAGFTSMAPDDHVKVLFPEAPGREPLLPSIGPNGIVWPSSDRRPIARDYTPRRDGDGPLVLDIVQHAGGRAAAWAAQARIGDRLGVAGPRGSHVLRRRFTRHVFAGDETALPAIRSWLAQLDAGQSATIFIEVTGDTDEQALASAASLDVTWVHRGPADAGTTDLLAEAFVTAAPDLSDAFVWLAGEVAAVRRLRSHVVDARGHDPATVSARGYWKLGTADHQEPHDD